MAKLILGIAGEGGAGKTTVGDYIEKKHGAKSLKFSGPLRDILERLNLEVTRGHLQQLSTVLRETFGQKLLSSVLLSDVKKSDAEIMFIDGIRRIEDIESFKSLPEFMMIYIDAPEITRYERVTGRREKSDDATKTLEQFKEEGKAESESMIRDLKNFAQFVIENTKSLDELYQEVDSIISKNLS